MPIRVSNSVEKDVFVIPDNHKVIAAKTSVTVLGDNTQTNIEQAGRYIQNVGSGICYYAFGTANCDPANFNGVLAAAPAVDANGFGAGQQIDVSNCGQIVSVWSDLGTTLAVTVLKRNDNAQGQGNILTANPR